ncbi:MAG: enoyl-CoA hydratase/isomerase family protein [Gammaproteobacteria bacterium]|nr:enoyl-CoA hydratase/isomerase family protein [Gammaproteobacteria bacterium]
MIHCEISGAVATATLSRPPLNAINEEWLSALAGAVQAAEALPTVAVLHLRSDRRTFSAGADLALLRERFASAAGRAAMVEFVRRMQQVFAQLERSRLVSVAELGGPALGGGFELALACDLRIAADEAKLGLPEAALGLLPAAGGTQRLTRLCGATTARRLILGAEVLNGRQALELGLVQWSMPAAELPARARELVLHIAGLPAAALAATKRCIAAAAAPGDAGFNLELEETARLYAVPDTQARVQKFLDQRR